MSIAITDEHRSLASTASDFLTKREARRAARDLLEAPTEPAPVLWDDIVNLGWLGVHLPEAHGGSGFGLEELVVIVEQLGRGLAPGPFVPTVIASAVIAAAADDRTKAALLPGLADGSVTAGFGLSETGPVLGGGLATLFMIVRGGDVLIVEAADVTVTVPDNLDPTRRSARVQLNGAPSTVLAGAGSIA